MYTMRWQWDVSNSWWDETCARWVKHLGGNLKKHLDWATWFEEAESSFYREPVGGRAWEHLLQAKTLKSEEHCNRSLLHASKKWFLKRNAAVFAKIGCGQQEFFRSNESVQEMSKFWCHGVLEGKATWVEVKFARRQLNWGRRSNLGAFLGKVVFKFSEESDQLYLILSA